VTSFCFGPKRQNGTLRHCLEEEEGGEEHKVTYGSSLSSTRRGDRRGVVTP